MTWPLTPFMSGVPARIGFYLTRHTSKDPVALRYWSGLYWYFGGMRVEWPPLEFAGLAFDPASVQPTFRFICPDDAGGAGWWVPKP